MGWMVVAMIGVASVASAQDESAVDIGRKVFAAQKCSICHAIAGQGNQRGALDDIGSRLSADEIRQWLMNAPEMAEKTKATRKPAMKVFATLPKADLDGLVAYLSSLKK
jgi:mono/diheme cytochrome c family protein